MQDIIALLIASLAAIYVGRVFWQSLLAKRSAGCGTCGGCSSSNQSLVQIQFAHAEAQRSQSQIEPLIHANIR
jgi:hypothetical protein